MSKVDKREQRIRENPGNVSLEDFEALIKKYGHVRTGGSHPKAVIGLVVFAYRRTNPVKPPYVRAILGIIDRQNKEGQE
jgi:hypothetical protein